MIKRILRWANKLLGKALVQKPTGPEITLAGEDAITVEVKDGKLMSIKKN